MHQWFDRDDRVIPPELLAEWNEWLQKNFDPIHYDSHQDKEHNPSKWFVETYCPPHLEKRVMDCLIKEQKHCGSHACENCNKDFGKRYAGEVRRK